MSAYLYACEHGHHNIVQLLCDAGCERAQTNREGFTGREMATLWQRNDVLAFLDTLGGETTPRAKGPSRMGKAKGSLREAIRIYNEEQLVSQKKISQNL